LLVINTIGAALAVGLGSEVERIPRYLNSIAIASGRRCPEQGSEGPHAGSAGLCSFTFRIAEFTAFGTLRLTRCSQ
jgi:hypothetical protein